MKKMTKSVMAAIAIVLILCTVIGGTIAWLATKTETVTNTFTYGDINLDLNETDTNKDGDNDPNTNNYAMLPGSTITKDPVITVEAGSEKCWLFVAVDKTGGNVTIGNKSYTFDSYLTYQIEDGWTYLGTDETVDYYYRAVDKVPAEPVEGVQIRVLKDNQVIVKEDVTKEMLNALDRDADGKLVAEENRVYPTLKVTACAVQYENLEDINDAWAVASGLFNEQ